MIIVTILYYSSKYLNVSFSFFSTFSIWIQQNSHLETSPLRPLLASQYWVIVLFIKICLGILYRIIYIGFVFKPLLVLIWGEVYYQCKPYIVVIIVDWSPIYVSSEQDPNCCHTQTPLDKTLVKKRILVRCFIQPITSVALLHIIVLLYISRTIYKKYIIVHIIIPSQIAHQTIGLE